MLAYWTWTDEEVQVDYLYPAGRLHFYDAATGQMCTSPADVSYPYFTNTLVWTPSGEVFLLSEDNRLIGLTPCRDDSPRVIEALPEPTVSITAAPNDRLLLRTSGGDLSVVELPAYATALVLSGTNTDYMFNWETRTLRRLNGRVVAGSYSPDGTYVAFSEGSSDEGNALLTRVINLLTGSVEAEVEWRYQPAKGAPDLDTWLSNRELLLASDVIGGPLIVAVGDGVVRVAAEYLGTDCAERVCETLAARPGDTETYHLLVQAPAATPDAQGPWLQYHPESGQVESLGLFIDPRFSPDGRWLVALQDLDGQDAAAVWLRSTDPSGAQTLAFGPVRRSGFLNWSPDSHYLALHLEDGVALLHFEGGWDLLGRWVTAEYEPVAALWSPDNQLLAIQAGSFRSSQAALFIVPVTE